METRVRAIPPTLNRFTSSPVLKVKKRKVAGYARVSTDMEEQQSSYSNQVDYYTNYIKSREDWEYVAVYTDEGISATSTRHREGFNRMIEDALNGHIELIVTKSISRFARNTVDSLTTIRKLKENGVEVYFEKENIWTFDSKGELLITIMSSLAQEESRSISENTTWGRRKSFADGKVSVAFSTFLGYDEGFKINDEQAETVRLIYKLYMTGLSYCAIAKELEKRGRLTATGLKRWSLAAVRSVLQNEKYKGDALLQKQYTADYLTKKIKKNNGELQQYFIEGHHEPIISSALFDMVQTEMERRKKLGITFSGKGGFAGKIICGECGHYYGRKTWHSTEKRRKTVYICNGRYQYHTWCKTRHLPETEIKQLFVKALESIVEDKEKTLHVIEKLQRETVADSNRLIEELEVVQGRIDETQGILERMIDENARMAQPQRNYQQKYEDAFSEYEKLKACETELEVKIRERSGTGEKLRIFTDLFQQFDGSHIEFDQELWGVLVENAKVGIDGKVTFRFLGGLETTV